MGNYKKIYPTEDKNLMKTYEDLLIVSEGFFRKQNMRHKDKSLPVLKKTQSFSGADTNRFLSKSYLLSKN